MARSISIVLLFSIFFLACEDTATTSTPPAKDPVQVTPPVTPKPVDKFADVPNLEKIGQTQEVTTFNAGIITAKAKGETWMDSPDLTALKFSGDQMSEVAKKSLEMKSINGPENIDQVLAIVTEEGYLDDSMESGKVILRLKKNKDIWVLEKATRVWKCRKGRGHQEFNAEPCG